MATPETLRRKGSSLTGAVGGVLYIYGAVEEVVGRACYGVGYPSLGLVDERHEGRLQVVALPQCGQCLAALSTVAPCH